MDGSLVKRMKWIKTATLALLGITVFVTLAYAVVYSTRNSYLGVDHSKGMTMRVYRLSERPETYAIIENDSYVRDAVNKTSNETFSLQEIEDKASFVKIATGRGWNYTWIPDFVQTESSYGKLTLQTVTGENWTWRPAVFPTEWETKGNPEFILWLPDDNYYFVHVAYQDGSPQFFDDLPPPTQTAVLLTIPWVVLSAVTVRARKISNIRLLCKLA